MLYPGMLTLGGEKAHLNNTFEIKIVAFAVL
jgi:hypothetical protein